MAVGSGAAPPSAPELREASFAVGKDEVDDQGLAADRKAAARLVQAQSALHDARCAGDVFLRELRRVGPYALEGIDEALLRVREDSRQTLWTRIEELRREAAARSPAVPAWRREPIIVEPSNEAEVRQTRQGPPRTAEPTVYPPVPIAAGIAAELVDAASAAPKPAETESLPVPREALDLGEEGAAGGALEEDGATVEGELEPPNHRARVWTRGGLGMGAAGLVALLFAGWAQWGSAYRAGLEQQELRNDFEISRALHALDADVGTQAETAGAPEESPDLGAPVAIVAIPSIDLETVSVEGATYAQLRQGLGHVPNSATPGFAGESILLGRRTSYGGPFSRLGELVPGDDVFLTTVQGRTHYRVTEPPEVVASEEEAPVGNGDRLTLMTSNPRFGISELLVVSASAQEALPPNPGRVATEPAAVDQQLAARGSTVPVVAWAGALAVLSFLLYRVILSRGRLALLVGLPVTAVVLLKLFESVDGLLPPTF